MREWTSPTLLSFIQTVLRSVYRGASCPFREFAERSPIGRQSVATRVQLKRAHRQSATIILRKSSDVNHCQNGPCLRDVQRGPGSHAFFGDRPMNFNQET